MNIDLIATLTVIGGLLTIATAFASLVWWLGELKAKVQRRLDSQDRKVDLVVSEEKGNNETLSYRITQETQQLHFEIAEQKAHIKQIEGFLEKNHGFHPRTYLEPGDSMGWRKE